MAFDFLGTLSLDKLMELENFLLEEIEDTSMQINTLMIEVNNLNTARNNLITADQNLGGNAIDSLFPTELPDVIRTFKAEDTNSANLIDKIKKPFRQNIKFKRERLEFKIKKLLDAAEQAKEMIDRKAIAITQTKELLSELRQLFNDNNKDHLFSTEDDLRNFRKGSKSKRFTA